MGVKIGADTVQSLDAGITLPGFDFQILTNLLGDLGPCTYPPWASVSPPEMKILIITPPQRVF